MPPRVASLGSLNLDFVRRVDEQALPEVLEANPWLPGPGETVPVDDLPEAVLSSIDRVSPGGKGANQAVAAATAGAHASIYGMIGPDAADWDLLDGIGEHGVDVAGVETAAVETGKALVLVAPDGENRIAVVSGANGAVDPAYVKRHVDAIGAADAVLLQNEIPIAANRALLESIADEGARPAVILDPAPVDGIRDLVAHPAVGVVTPNAAEYDALGDALDGIDATVIVTRGPDPVVVRDGERSERIVPPWVDARDTTGAGDVFAGYLARELADGSDVVRAARIATVAASLSTEHDRGVHDSVPTYDDVLQRLQ